MKKTSILLGFAALFGLAACNSNSTETDKLTANVLQEGNRAFDKNIQAKMLLARSWEVEGEFRITFAIDGRFEAYFSPEVLSVGSWSINTEETVLTIKEDKAEEGKGKALYLVYNIVRIDEQKQEMLVEDETGKQLKFIAKDD